MHDSPDYYKLKCSIFNDDKKTDLIGEAWIDLNGVIIPGGGQNDLWHQLQFKGKYAGDVRMELTYYDTRPKDATVMEKKRDREKVEQGRAHSSKDEGTGSRRLGPREVKRRPLPMDPLKPASIERPPLQEAHSAPIPQLYQHDPVPDPPQEQSGHWGPDSFYQLPTSNERSSYPAPAPTDQLSYDLPAIYDDHQSPQEPLHAHSPLHHPSIYDSSGHPTQPPDSDNFSFHSAPSPFPPISAQASDHTSFVNERRHSGYLSDDPQVRSSPHADLAPYGSSPPSFGHDRFAPGTDDHANRGSFGRYSTSPVKSDVFRDSPLRHSISQHDVEPFFQERYDVSDEEGPPPPPPAHRTNVLTSTLLKDPHPDMEPVQIPRPLSLGSSNRRMSPFDRSPLQTIERNYDAENQSSVHSIPESTLGGRRYLAYSKPAYPEEDRRVRGNSYDRAINTIENIPPSLRSGCGRGIEEIEDPWMGNERVPHRQSIDCSPVAENREIRTLATRSVPYRAPHVEDEQQMITTSGSPYNLSQTTSPRPRAVTTSPRPQAVTTRKSVSPQPLNGQEERGSTSVPFGPDSYDVFNPSSPLSSAVAGPENHYETPEQAKEAARQHEVQKLRDQGPIIGNDGRVIDPTDHLPTDTWAPEPVRKNRKPEMVIRYKTKETVPRTPQGYGSSPRPHSVAGPVYGSSPLAAESPSGWTQRAGRNRLQKQIPGRPLPGQPYQQTHSSPTVPTANYNTPSPRSSYSSRPQPSEYAVYSQQSQRDSYGGIAGGPYAGAPPLPAKVPISPVHSDDRYGGYGGMDALSAELSTIDIGSGMGGRGSWKRRQHG